MNITATGTEDLTKTEFQISELIARGYSEKEIAAKRFNSVSTIRKHTQNIRKKLNARSAVDVARKFILSLDDPKKYFAAIAFLMIQGFAVCNSVQIERQGKPARRIVNSSRRNIS